MGLKEQNQQLRLEPKEIFGLLKWLGIDLMKLATARSETGLEAEAQELLTIVSEFPDAEDKLAGYADEVKAGRIVRWTQAEQGQ